MRFSLAMWYNAWMSQREPVGDPGSIPVGGSFFFFLLFFFNLDIVKVMTVFSFRLKSFNF